MDFERVLLCLISNFSEILILKCTSLILFSSLKLKGFVGMPWHLFVDQMRLQKLKTPALLSLFTPSCLTADWKCRIFVFVVAETAVFVFSMWELTSVHWTNTLNRFSAGWRSPRTCHTLSFSFSRINQTNAFKIRPTNPQERVWGKKEEKINRDYFKHQKQRQEREWEMGEDWCLWESRELEKKKVMSIKKKLKSKVVF